MYRLTPSSNVGDFFARSSDVSCRVSSQMLYTVIDGRGDLLGSASAWEGLPSRMSAVTSDQRVHRSLFVNYAFDTKTGGVAGSFRVSRPLSRFEAPAGKLPAPKGLKLGP